MTFSQRFIGLICCILQRRSKWHVQARKSSRYTGGSNLNNWSFLIIVSYDVDLEKSSCTEECNLLGVCLCHLCRCCSICTSQCQCTNSKQDKDIKMKEILGLGDHSYRWISLTQSFMLFLYYKNHVFFSSQQPNFFDKKDRLEMS